MNHLLLLSMILFVNSAVAQNKKAIKQFNKGEINMAKRKYVAAVVNFSDAISKDRNFTKAYLQRGLAFYNMAKYGNAVKDFRKCIDIDSLEILAYINGIEACYLNEQYEDGLKFAALLGQNMPKNIGPAHYQKGRIYQKMGEYANAISQYQEAISVLNSEEDQTLISLCKEKIEGLKN